MKSIFKTIAMLAVLFCYTAIAHAVPQGMWGDQPFAPTYNTGSAWTTVDISGGVPTDAITTYGYRFLTFEFEYVNSAATSVTMTCRESDAPAGTYKDIPGLVPSGSTLTSDILTWSNAVAGNEEWTWTVSLLGYSYVKCTFTAVGGGAGDTLTLDGVLGE